MNINKTVEILEVVVRRPNGDVETITRTDNVRFLGTNEVAQERCIKATRDAGKGDILSFAIVDKIVQMTEQEQRRELCYQLQSADDFYDAAREKDFDNDIGMHLSLKAMIEVKKCRKALFDFDDAHPELVAELKEKEAARDARLIQSALNA